MFGQNESYVRNIYRHVFCIPSLYLTYDSDFVLISTEPVQKFLPCLCVHTTMTIYTE